MAPEPVPGVGLGVGADRVRGYGGPLRHAVAAREERGCASGAPRPARPPRCRPFDSRSAQT